MLTHCGKWKNYLNVQQNCHIQKFVSTHLEHYSPTFCMTAIIKIFPMILGAQKKEKKKGFPSVTCCCLEHLEAKNLVS